MGISAFDTRVAYAYSVKIDHATGVGLIIMPSQPPYGQLPVAIVATNDDTIDHVLNLGLYNLGQIKLLGSVNVPAGQGTAGTPGIDVIAACVPMSAGVPSLDADSSIAFWLSVVPSVGQAVHVSYFAGLF